MTDKYPFERIFEPLQPSADMQRVGSLLRGEYPVFLYTPPEQTAPIEDQKIRRQLIVLIERGFGQTYGEDLSDEDVDQFLGGGDMYILSTQARELVGVEIVKMLFLQGKKIFFTAATVIHPDHQGKRLHTNFKEFVIQKEQPDFIAGRTQNPAVYLSYQHGEGTVYPAADHMIPPDIQALGSELAGMLTLDQFEPETFIQRQAYGEAVYGQNTYPEIDSDKQPALHQLFSHLHVEQGDAFLILKHLQP